MESKVGHTIGCTLLLLLVACMPAPSLDAGSGTGDGGENTLGASPCGEGEIVQDADGRTLLGSCLLNTDEKVLELHESGVTRIEGSLVIRGDQVLSVELPALHSVRALYVTSTASVLEQVRLEELQVVNGVLDVILRGGARLHLPKLERVEGSVRISGDSDARVIEFERLEYAEGVAISGTTQALDARFPNISDIGAQGLLISENQKLESFALPSLARVAGDISVSDNPQLPRCLVDELLARVTVDGEVIVTSGRNDCDCEGMVAACP